jgi:hypothetical protein
VIVPVAEGFSSWNGVLFWSVIFSSHSRDVRYEPSHALFRILVNAFRRATELLIVSTGRRIQVEYRPLLGHDCVRES